MYVDDATRLKHMRDAAQEAIEFVSGRGKDDLDSDGLLYHAVKDCITIVGEAAYRVSRNYQDQHPEIPWRSLIRFRHELVHDYFRIDPAVMWDTITESFPPLIDVLAKVIERDFGG